MVYKSKYFNIKELVSPIVFKAYGDFAWSFFDEQLLKDLDLLRELWGNPLIINDWSWGGVYKESGLRCNVDYLVKSKSKPYLSAHTMGKAVDIKTHTHSNKKLYLFILANQEKFKSFNRLEDIKKTNGWVHVDMFQAKGDKITIF